MTMTQTTSEPLSPIAPWIGGKLNEQRKALRKAMLDTVRAYADSKKGNLPIVGFRPEYPTKRR